MSKVTSKLQVTLPKALAKRFGIEPGMNIEWEAGNDVIRVIPPRSQRSRPSVEERLSAFDAATKRQGQREQKLAAPSLEPAKRGWRREDLYRRGRAG